MRLVFVTALMACLGGGTAWGQHADATATDESKPLGLGGQLSAGVSMDTNLEFRARIEGLYSFGNLSVDGHLQIDAWVRSSTDQGTKATGFGPGVGIRYALGGNRSRGVYFSGGATYLRLVGEPEERTDPTGFGTRLLKPDVFLTRVGIGYGFPTTSHITIAVKAEVEKQFIGHKQPFPKDPCCDDNFPDPLAFHLGIEFIHWP